MEELARVLCAGYSLNAQRGALLSKTTLIEPMSQSNSDQLVQNAAAGMEASKWAVLCNVVLASVKILTGVLGNSYALIADGVESVLDLFSSLVVWGSLKISARPPDENHPYGHGRAETLGAMVVAVGLLAAALGIAIQSVREITTPQTLPEPFTLYVLVAVVAAKEGLFRFLWARGESIGSKAVQADAWHHRSDALTSVAAFIGISIALVGGEEYASADDWAALFASGVILYNGARLFRSTLDDVMDAALPEDNVNQVRHIASEVDGVMEIEKCKVRRSGLSLFVDIHVVVDGEISVRRGHVIGHKVKDALMQTKLGILDVSVHIEPSRES